MKKLRYLIDVYRLNKLNKDISKITNQKQWLQNIWRFKSVFKKEAKGSRRRNVVASIIKKVRAANPYQPIDYSKAKKDSISQEVKNFLKIKAKEFKQWRPKKN